MPVFLELLAWQIVLGAAWFVSRRVRQLERRLARTYRPPCYDQVGALREEVSYLREEASYLRQDGIADVRSQDRRLRDLEISARRIDGQLHVVSKQLDELAAVTAQLLLEPHRRPTARSA